MAVTRVLSDHENTLSSFYASFPYPLRPMYFDAVDDPHFYSTLVTQEVGRPGPEQFGDIWVAGCGTNQALITALRFPDADVLGTDVSPRSLEICEENAAKIGVSNLRLEQQGITHSARIGEFDMVICTGVIHHNPEPERCLTRLAAALRDHGVLELMVYNKFHRREPSSFQEALRILFADSDGDHPMRLAAARSVAGSIRVESTLTACLRSAVNDPDPVWADTWMNPCERAYDVDSLWEMAGRCGLVVEAPKVNPFDKARTRFLWTLDLSDPGPRQAFFGLNDRARWQIVNLLHLDSSPMLWFYLRPDRDGRAERASEADRNRLFLDSVPTRPAAVRRRYMPGADGKYALSSGSAAVDKWPPRAEVQAIWNAVDGQRTLREIFADIGRGDDFNSVYKARVMLTSTEFPHLVTRRPGE